MRPNTHPRARGHVRLAAAVALSLLAALLLSKGREVPRASAQSQSVAYLNFEGPHVHPLALTPDGTRLLAVNSPSGTLSVFQLSSGAPVLSAEIPVGLEPVSVKARNNREAWVVNWLSDSVSVVDLATGNVRLTVDVGDEPTDVTFAGPDRSQAYVCVSGLEHVKVLDVNDPGAAPKVIEIFGKQPRALATDATGEQVFVSVFESGNQTTIVPFSQVAEGGGLPAPSPAMNPSLPAAPNTSLIVKWNGAAWADENGDTKWNKFVPYTLADVDVVRISAAAAPAVAEQLRGLGTHLGNAVYDSSAKRLYALNLESDNVRRFEPNLQGRFQDNRVALINFGAGGVSGVTQKDLNPHVNFGVREGSDAERAKSLALPADIVRSGNGLLYVSAVGSDRVGVLDPAGSVLSRIKVGGGPTGLAIDDAKSQLYVLNRFEQTVSVVDTVTRAEKTRVPVGFNPEPGEVRRGRRFLYSADFSSHGTVSCASCHQGGHRDGVAWDLGNPLGTMQSVGPFNLHPMKGPMTTQSLRAIIGVEPLHWRGDRANLGEFNPAFVNLQGSKRLLTDAEMADFEAFTRALAYPPNPNENLNRTFPNPPSGPSAQRGSQLFQTAQLGGTTCNTCHTTFPGFGPGTEAILFSGGIFPEPQAFKVPQLRGLYQKVGMSRAAGEHRTGFGFAHDGRFDSVLNFLRQPAFSLKSDAERRDVEAFIMSFDTGAAPAVGLQVTVNADNKGSAAVAGRIGLLVSQAGAGNCDLVAKGVVGGRLRGFMHVGNGSFRSDAQSEPQVSWQALVGQVGAGSELTFTGVPPGTGRRYGIDRNDDGVLDADSPNGSVSINGRVVDAAGQGVAAVTLTLSGSQSAVAETDAAGNFTFNNVLAGGTHTVRPSRGGLAFSPPSFTFTNPASNQTANFTAKPQAGQPNRIDDTQFFVEQQYRDFLGREADAAGLQFWMNPIDSCGPDAPCREAARVNVSGAFFRSIEFQETGFLVYRLHQAAFNTGPLLSMNVFQNDTREVARGVVVLQGNWAEQLEQNKRAFVEQFVARPQFLALYPQTMSAADFVDALNANAGGSLSAAERDALVGALASGARTRAEAVRAVAEDADFRSQETNRAFVLMEYFGYLRRSPVDPPDGSLIGYDHWLTKLNQFGGDFVRAEMVKAFLSSDEYRARFAQ